MGNSKIIEMDDRLVIGMPIPEGADPLMVFENVRSIALAKEPLLKKALGVDSLPIRADAREIHLGFFHEAESPEEVHAYMTLAEKLVKFAASQGRVSMKIRNFENEKYAFRCFLLRLGFIGDKYKTDRKVLLKNLTGSGAFKRTRYATLPTPENTARIDMEEARRRLKDPEVQAEIRDILNGGGEE